MPTLFISYKRGTKLIPDLLDALRAAHYRLWFDRDDIHTGENWREAINRGVDNADAVIVGLTQDACASPYVQYEVERARSKNKPIFPVMLDALDPAADPAKLKLTDIQFVDFTQTGAEAWDAAVARLLADMARLPKLKPSRHDIRRERGGAAHTLHQRYLAQLVGEIGTLSLAQIKADQRERVLLENVYVDSPTGLTLSVEVQDWHVVDYWIDTAETRAARPDDDAPKSPTPRTTPAALGYDTATFDKLIERLEGKMQQEAEELRRNPPKKGEYRYIRWQDREHTDVLTLGAQHIAAARDRLALLGAPGSGKSTCVKHLALCLAGAALDGWTRSAGLADLDGWTHGALTPIYVELRRLVASKHFPPLGTPAKFEHLWAYIVAELLGADLRAYADDLAADLREGAALLILDGLDEVPYPDGKLRARQEQLQALAADLAHNPATANSRLLVASRPHAYERWLLKDFEAVTITDFEDSHRIALATRLYREAGVPTDDADAMAQRLNDALRPVDRELKDRPLFLTLMATIFLENDGKALPTRRGALYRRSILLLLERWTAQNKPDAKTLQAILGDGVTEDDVYKRLAALAYDVHAHFGEQQGTPEIGIGRLFEHLTAKPKPKHGEKEDAAISYPIAGQLIPYLSENAGVLVSPGQDAEREVFRFAHRSFQEYLAAAQIAADCARAGSYALVRQLIESKPAAWREPCALVGDVLTDTAVGDAARANDLWDLLDELLDDEALTLNPSPERYAGRGTLNPLLPEGEGSGMRADDPRWWAVWLAARITLEQDLHKLAVKGGKKATRQNLVDWLVALVQTPAALKPVDRALCGRALALLGDPRRGTGVIASPSPVHPHPPAPSPLVPRREGERTEGSGGEDIPDILWCPVPAGKFLYGDQREEASIDYDYAISKYPLTNAQFAPFIADGGYANEAWWTPDGWAAKEAEGWTQPRYWDDPRWNLPNHPVVGVSWYEAVAYCNWLNAKLIPTLNPSPLRGEGRESNPTLNPSPSHREGLTPPLYEARVERGLGGEVRLPTEQEWEKAARGTNGLIYPWDDDWDETRCNNRVTDTPIGQTSAVGIFPDGASPYEVMDMSGNVWEWCATKYQSPEDNDLNGTDVRVLRGGSWWVINSNDLRAACRFRGGPIFWDSGGGVRFARSR